MKKKFSHIAVILFALLLVKATSLGQEPDWLARLKSVRPIENDRKTVRNHFGAPFLVEENRDFFDLPMGKLVAVYSFGECSSRDVVGRWRVPKDTLINLDLDVKEDVIFSALKLNLKGFKKKVPNDTPDLTLYTNTQSGIEYTRFQKYLSDVSIFPSKPQSSYRCEK